VTEHDIHVNAAKGSDARYLDRSPLWPHQSTAGFSYCSMMVVARPLYKSMRIPVFCAYGWGQVAQPAALTETRLSRACVGTPMYRVSPPDLSRFSAHAWGYQDTSPADRQGTGLSRVRVGLSLSLRGGNPMRQERPGGLI